VHVRIKLAVGVAVVAALVIAVTTAVAGGGKQIRERLTGYQETPLALSSPGTGEFRAKLQLRDREISYTLSYASLPTPVTQAHIHFGAPAQTGGISVFLCTNLGNGPAGTQACPPAPATISGTIRPADVIGPAGQGIAAGEFDELISAIFAGVTYANVHTTAFPGGEIRAQLHVRGDD
jgi:hypothetical protein